MFKRSLILLLAGACSYQESVGTAMFGADAGVGGQDGSGGGFGGGSDAAPDAAPSAHILSDDDACEAFSVRGAEVYCLSTEGEPTATDGAIRILIRRITDDEQIVTDGTLTAVYQHESSLAQDADHLYFSAEVTPATQFAEASWSIFAFDKDQHTFTPISSGWNEQPRHLQVVGGDVFFFALEHVPENTTSHYDRLYRVPATGGPATLLTTSIASAEAVASDGTYIYAADFGRYQLAAVQIAAPHRVLTLVTTGVPWDTAACPPQALLVHGDWLYYSTQGPTSAIRRVPRPLPATTQDTVSPVNELIASNQFEAFAMAADDHDLYYTEYFEGLFRAPLDGSAPRQMLLSFGEQGNLALARRDDRLYFTARHQNAGTLIAKYHLSP